MTTTEVAVAALTDLAVGEGRAFDVDGRQVAVFRLRDGRVVALDAACPHRGGPLADGQLDGRVVVCPLHQHAFELETGHCATGAPDTRSYPVRVDDDGQVFVATG